MTDRPKTHVEIIGERCLQVCKDHANDKDPDLRLLADFVWALDLNMSLILVSTPPGETL